MFTPKIEKGVALLILPVINNCVDSPSLRCMEIGVIEHELLISMVVSSDRGLIVNSNPV